MKFDPNYTYDSDSDQEDGKSSDSDGDGDDYSDYSDEGEDTDDDDSSWKVRSSAVRALTAVIDSRNISLSLLWETSAVDHLLSRFKEREEGVRVDVINALSKLIKYSIEASTGSSPASLTNGDVEMTDVDDESKYDSPSYMLGSLQKKAPLIIRACEKELKCKTKTDRSKTAVLALFTVMCEAPGGLGNAKQVEIVMKAISISLSPSASKAIKLDSLVFLQSALKCENHLPSSVRPHVLPILPLVSSAAAEDWYKIIAEALRVLSLVPKLLIRDDSSDDDMDVGDSVLVDDETTKKCVTILYDGIQPRLTENDIDQEIKETSIIAIGELVSRLGNLLPSDSISSILSLLLERLGNEITRNSALRTLGRIATSPLKIDISSVLSDATVQLAHFLRQSSRSLRLCVLETISSFVQSNSSKMNFELFELILTEAGPLITDADLQVCQLAVNVSYDVLVSSEESIKTIKTTTLAPLLKLAASPLLQGMALHSTTKFLEELSVSKSSDVTYAEISDSLYAAVDQETKQEAMSNLSKCLASICAVAQKKLQNKVISDLVKDVKASDALKRRLGLLTLGALGERVDLSGVKKLGDVLLAAFSNDDDQTKTAAAFALGHVSVRAMDVFLPVILEALSKGTSVYLILSSLKELIVCAIANDVDLQARNVDLILPHLVSFCENEDEGVRSMVAECMGCFISMKAKQILPTLKDLAQSKSDGSESSNLVLWTIAMSLRNALGSSNTDAAVVSDYIGVFLEFLKSEDFQVRTATLLMINAAVWYRHEVIASKLTSIVLPTLLELLELKVVRTIDLGPFKHKVDDALPLRKACISIIDSTLSMCPIHLSIPELLPKLAACFADDADVIVASHQLVIKITKMYPAIVAQNIPLFIDSGLQKTVQKKVKEGAAANVREKTEELIRSGLKVAMEWEQLSDVSVRFTDFLESTVKAKDSLSRGIWEELHAN